MSIAGVCSILPITSYYESAVLRSLTDNYAAEPFFLAAKAFSLEALTEICCRKRILNSCYEPNVVALKLLRRRIISLWTGSGFTKTSDATWAKAV